MFISVLTPSLTYLVNSNISAIEVSFLQLLFLSNLLEEFSVCIKVVTL